MNLTFREKSLWLLLLSLLVANGIYFASVLPTRLANVAPTHVATFVGMLILLIIFQIVGQTILAIANRRELAGPIQSDERDALIKLKSSRLASYVLVTGVFCSLCVALLVPGNFAFVHVLLAFWVLAQAMEISLQLVLYHRGAN
ncbi:hypothetical protein [Cognatiluteimonas profundi]|uniref:hypothetical protein n=1 Tax=Cognatiluteimonas profundi TaxID=2594501 RepID=UPI00131A884A|nr:hypothetical protein [Lysobacter profundi]